jgi:hypothetical protein
MKRGQEEIVGFGALLVVLAIVGVILLGLYLRQPVQDQGTFPEAGSFLDALPSVTSTCSFAGERLISVHELISACIKQPGKTCGGQSVCTVMNQTVQALVTQAFPVGSRIQGYRFIIEEQGTPSLSLQQGNCTTYTGDQRFLPGTQATIRLLVC